MLFVISKNDQYQSLLSAPAILSLYQYSLRLWYNAQVWITYVVLYAIVLRGGGGQSHCASLQTPFSQAIFCFRDLLFQVLLQLWRPHLYILKNWHFVSFTFEPSPVQHMPTKIIWVTSLGSEPLFYAWVGFQYLVFRFIFLEFKVQVHVGVYFFKVSLVTRLQRYRPILRCCLPSLHMGNIDLWYSLRC